MRRRSGSLAGSSSSGCRCVLLLAFLLARTLGHVLFLFLTAAVIAFTLNPLVRELTRFRLPRGLSVAVVSIVFAAVFIGLLVALGTVVVSETRSAAERIDTYLTEEDSATDQTGVEVDVDRFQAWLDDHGLEGIRIEQQLDDLTDSIGAGDVSGYVQDAISFAQGAALSVILLLFSVDPRRRDRDLHAPRHAAARAVDRPPLSRRRAACR